MGRKTYVRDLVNPKVVVMAARKRKRVSKRAHSSTVKAKLGHVIKSLQVIKQHVDGKTVKRGKGGRSAKTIKMPTLSPVSEMEPITLDSPTLRRPARMSYSPATLRSASATLRSY